MKTLNLQKKEQKIVYEKRTFIVKTDHREFLYTCCTTENCIDGVRSLFPGEHFVIGNEMGKVIFNSREDK